MTTVAQMIEWMKTLPQDAEVECGVEVTKDWSTWMEMKPVRIDYCDIFDYTNSDNHSMAGKVIIEIQGE